ncbi:MAG: hypothetical protein JJT76_00755 [Clostridiaceae bacterium]|nr:hypothetical protein [Clostridiaceae bacterium]
MEKELDWEEIIPFDGDTKDTMYKYHCCKCGYEEYVPDFIVDETAGMIEFWKKN